MERGYVNEGQLEFIVVSYFISLLAETGKHAPWSRPSN